MRRSGTNPTAAAVGLLQLVENEVNGLTPEVREGVTNCLAEMVSPEGGLCADGRAPMADLLSTFTATWTLAELSGLERIDTRQVLRFARLLERPSGGFRGGLWDDGYDVEYTFYGLGVLGLLS